MIDPLGSVRVPDGTVQRVRVTWTTAGDATMVSVTVSDPDGITSDVSLTGAISWFNLTGDGASHTVRLTGRTTKGEVKAFDLAVTP